MVANMSESGVRVVPNDFHKLRVTDIDQTGLSFIIGKRGTGKTRLVCDLAYNWYVHGMKCKRILPDGSTESYMRPLDLVMCFSPTELLKQDFKVFVPSAFRYPKFREQIVMDLVAKQKATIEKYGDDKCQRVLLIIDDCAFEKGFFKTETMRFIAMNLRHYNVHVIITVQYALDVPPPIRQNIDYCFCLHDNSNSNKKRYWEHFYGQIDTQRNFNEIFDALTNDYSCMVGCSGVQSSTLTDTLFWYRGEVKLPSEFRIGRPAYWKLSELTVIPKVVGRRDTDEDAPVAMLQRSPHSSSSSSSSSPSCSSSSSRPSSFRTPIPQVRAIRAIEDAPQNKPMQDKTTRRLSRTPYSHSGSSIIRRSRSSLPVEIVVA